MGQHATSQGPFASAASPKSARYWKYALLTLAALVALLDLLSLSTWQRSLDPGVRGTLMARFAPAVHAGGWQTVVELDAASPLRKSGASVGDAVRFRYAGEAWLRRFGTDERIELELRSDSGVRAVTVQPIAVEFPRSRAIPGFVSGWLESILSLLMGALLALRRPDSPAIRGLAVALILNALDSYGLPSGEIREQMVVWLSPLLEDIAGMGALWFAFQARDDGSFWKRKSTTLAVIGLLLAILAIPLARWGLQWRLGYEAAAWSVLPGLAWLSGFEGYQAMWVALDAITVVALWSSWRQASGAMRLRIGWIALALGVPVLWQTLNDLVWQLLSGEYAYPGTWVSQAGTYVRLGGILLLGFAVLRHRVFDFGFVVHRALVYSIVSLMILVLLGVGKWATESLLERFSGERSFNRDALIVIGVVAAFAALQQRISKIVTRVFFSTWYDSAQALHEFVDDAAQLTDADVVRQRFVAAVDAFTGGQGCALYVADADGQLRLDRATLDGMPSEIGSEDGLVAELRKRGRRVDLGPLRDRLRGDWAFPMRVRGSLQGALLIGPRTEGISYRQEELVQLADSVRTIGLHLDSLGAAELRQQHGDLVKRMAELAEANRSLAAENADLKGSGG